MRFKRATICIIKLGLVTAISSIAFAKSKKIEAADKFEKQLENEVKAGELDFYSVIAVLEEDVFDAYAGYDKKYESPLQKKVFLKSKDYQKKLKHLNSLKQKVMNTEYYIVEDKAFKENYNIQKKAFLAETLYRADRGESLKIIEQVSFPDFEYLSKKSEIATVTYLPIKVTEELALKIESNKDNYELRVYFKPNGLVKVSGGLYIVKCNTCLASKDSYVAIWDKEFKKKILVNIKQ